MHGEKTFGVIIDTNVKDLSEKRIPEYFLISMWGMYSVTNLQKHSFLGVQKNIYLKKFSKFQGKLLRWVPFNSIVLGHGLGLVTA